MFERSLYFYIYPRVLASITYEHRAGKSMHSYRPQLEEEKLLLTCFNCLGCSTKIQQWHVATAVELDAGLHRTGHCSASGEKEEHKHRKSNIYLLHDF